jgi:hypothetical protein
VKRAIPCGSFRPVKTFTTRSAFARVLRIGQRHHLTFTRLAHQQYASERKRQHARSFEITREHVDTESFRQLQLFQVKRTKAGE